MPLLIWGIMVSGQNNSPKLIEVTPPSPSAAALAKFGDVPVSLATGLPQIGIPIYAYAVHDLVLNISLDYHAGGIRVQERASNVGLGWALNAGGVVTRTVRGIADETPSNGFWAVAIPANDFAGNSPSNTSLRPFNNIHAGVQDGQLDLFTYNFGGRSGQFHFGKGNDTLMNTTERLRISKTVGTVNGVTAISQIIIVDEGGYRYVFSAPEMMTTNGAVWTGSKHFVTAWYITELTAPNGLDKIIFEYDNTAINNYVTSTTSTSYTRIGGTGYFNGSGQNSQSVQGKRLKKITFNNGVWIDIAYNSATRSDLPGDHLLNKITINDGINKRGFVLGHDYSLGRATLKSVTPFGGASETPDKPYLFEYFTSGAMPTMSSGTDHWGYYVGPGFSGNQIPREVFPSGMGPYFELPGVNKDTHPTYVKVGSLQKITYPTGGYTLFEMEANQANHSWLNKHFTVGGTTYSHIQQYVGGLRVKKISDYDGVASQPATVKEYEYTMPNGTTSSGVLGCFPTYTYRVMYDYRQIGQSVPTNEPYNPNLDFIVRSGSSVYEMVYGGGSPVVYERVVERRTSGGASIGHTVSTFTANQPVIGISMPITPPDQKNWSSGLLKQKDVYNSSNMLINRTINEYKYILHNYPSDPTRRQRFRSIAIMPVKFLIPAGPVDYNFTPFAEPIYFLSRDYYPPAGRAELIRTTEITYEPTGNYQRIVGSSYHPSLYYKKTDTLTDSRGLKQITRYTYAPDMVSAGRDPVGVYAGMVNKNIIRPVIEEISLQGSTQLMLTRTNYYQPYTGIYVPQTVVTKFRAEVEDVRLRYGAYTNRGRILTSSLEGGPQQSYLWSYNGQYVVAEVSNAVQSDIAYACFESDGKGNWAYFGTTVADATSPSGRRAYNLGGGNLVKGGLVTSRRYVLTYWAKSPSAGGISGGTASVIRTHNGWTHYRRVLTGVTSVSLGGSVRVDDVRLHPLDAAMETYTYDPLVGMTSHTDASGNVTHYQYDPHGRLSAVRDLRGNLVEDYKYHYRP